MVCTPAAGLLTFTASLGADTGSSAFDEADDAGRSGLEFLPGGLNLSTLTPLVNSETGDILLLTGMPGGGFYSLENGSFSIIGAGDMILTPTAGVPEPRSVILLVTLIALVGYLTRRKIPVVGLS